MPARKKFTPLVTVALLALLLIARWVQTGHQQVSAPPALPSGTQPESPTNPSTTTPSSNGSPKATADQHARIAASNLPGLRAKVDQEVTVFGRVQRASKSSSGHQFLNFRDSEFSVICMNSDVGNFDNGGPADLFDGHDVEVIGRLERYRGKLQIRLLRPDQIRIAKPGRGPPATGVALKRTGNNEWLSPAGLVYRGRDPEGLTRVEHIERHTRDLPDRDGPHGVFDGGPEVAFGVIDEAWQRIRNSRIEPRVEGDRSVYDVSFGRRVGFLGGRAGGRQRHPDLQRVRIVVETGTQNIVTAFPR